MGGRRGKTRPAAPVDRDTALAATRKEGMASLKELGNYTRHQQLEVARRTQELKNLQKQKTTGKGRTPTKHG